MLASHGHSFIADVFQERVVYEYETLTTITIATPYIHILGLHLWVFVRQT